MDVNVSFVCLEYNQSSNKLNLYTSEKLLQRLYTVIRFFARILIFQDNNDKLNQRFSQCF